MYRRERVLRPLDLFTKQREGAGIPSSIFSMCMYIYIYIYIYSKRLSTVVPNQRPGKSVGRAPIFMGPHGPPCHGPPYHYHGPLYQCIMPPYHGPPYNHNGPTYTSYSPRIMGPRSMGLQPLYHGPPYWAPIHGLPSMVSHPSHTYVCVCCRVFCYKGVIFWGIMKGIKWIVKGIVGDCLIVGGSWGESWVARHTTRHPSKQQQQHTHTVYVGDVCC